jgi:hypothetical protein
MKWKAACLDLLEWELSHGRLSDDVHELAEEIWGLDVAFEVYDAYKKQMTFKARMEKRDRSAFKRFKKNFKESSVGNDLRTPEGQLEYLKAAEKEAMSL